MFEIIPNWHPLFVHFTLALFLLAAGLFAVAPLMKSPLKEQWQTVARWNLWFGAGFSIITGLAGLYAYNTVAHDTPSHAAMTEHRNWAIFALILILILAVWSIVRERRNHILGTMFIVAMLMTGGVLAVTAWHGGEVVYRYGVGVMSLPKTEDAGHTHEHADGRGHEPAGGTPSMNESILQDGQVPQVPRKAEEAIDTTDKHSTPDGHTHE